jgi:hypothetical protein
MAGFIDRLPGNGNLEFIRMPVDAPAKPVIIKQGMGHLEAELFGNTYLCHLLFFRNHEIRKEVPITGKTEEMIFLNNSVRRITKKKCKTNATG